MPATPKGYRYPVGGAAANDLDLFIQQLAEDAESIPDALYALLGHLHTGTYSPVAHTHAEPAFVGCRVRRGADFAVPNNVGTAVVWDKTSQDTGGFHAAYSTDLVIPAGKAGMYAYAASGIWEANAVGQRTLAFHFNNVAQPNLVQIPAVSATIPQSQSIPVDLIRCAVGDIINLFAYQDSGAERTLAGSGNTEPSGFTWAVLYRVGL